MSYILRRYAHGAKRYRAWFLLSFLMPGLYLLSAFYAPDRHTVWQDVQLPAETRFASTNTPTVFNTIDEVVADQALFFQNNFAVNRYFNLSMENVQHLEKERYQKVTAAIRANITLAYTNGIARITYLGKDPELGNDLVGYYARRLVRQAREGIERSGLLVPQNQQPKLASGIESSAIRALWRPDRQGPLLTLFIASVLAVLVLIAALEWNDAALKSERQIARYVNLPVLGSLPDLNRITKVIGDHPSHDDMARIS
ncbi:hypothetical protein DSLASN_25010 [Desulfoluna limicola]|uniref:Lipopolysaccharide biosynthesis protein n=1 Tax=Desulfoluna limicola TaxID=2810562 RepID=A0ABM7PII4_9BACT|nr:hypothetical protein DSLASN_25010 [Desulfoluna limicola]